MAGCDRIDELGVFKHDKNRFSAIIEKHKIPVSKLSRPISPSEISGILRQLREKYGEDVDKRLSGSTDE